METGSDINLVLRTEILNFALNLENGINSLLLVVLSIFENTPRKALTNINSGISFKNKIDLLFDIGIIDSDQHKKMLLIMEFRNQFLHNIECISFEKAIELLGADRGSNLLKFNDMCENECIENDYRRAYKNLYFECLKIISKKFKEKRKFLEMLVRTPNNLAEKVIYLNDSYFGLIHKILLLCENSALEIPEVLNLAGEISKTIEEDQALVFSSEKYTELQKELETLSTPDMIHRYFRR
jgi:hypothetical protein